MFYLDCFHIVDNRVRYRALKIIKAYGTRVQKSVFECTSITEEQFLKMKQNLEDCIDNTRDSARCYFLCRTCMHKVKVLVKARKLRRPGFLNIGNIDLTEKGLRHIVLT